MDDYFLFHTKKEYEQQLSDYFSTGRYEEGLFYLEQIENRVIDIVWLNFTRGKLYNALGQYHIALPYLLKANQQSKESITLFSELGWTYNRLEQFDEALKYLEACICMEREDAWLYSELAYSYLKKEMWEEAIIYLLNGLELKPADRWTLEQLANAYSHTGQYIEANEINIELLQQTDDEEILEDIITLNEINETMNEQVIYLDKLMKVARHKSFVLYHYGVYLNFNKEYDKAIEMLKKIPEKQMDSEGWIELGYAYHQSNKIIEAIEVYEKAYKIEPEHLFLLSELAYLHGVIHDYSKELFYLDEAYRYGRHDTWVYLNYARVYLYGLKDYPKAHQYLVEAIKFAPDDEEVQFLYSEYEWFMNDEEKAQQRLLTILSQRLQKQMPDSFYMVKMNLQKAKQLMIDDIERVYQFSEGLAYVETSKHGGFINEQGDIVINLTLAIDETKRQDTFMFKQGYAIIHQESELLYGLINQEGEKVIDLMYDDIYIYSDHVRLTLGPVTILQFKQVSYVFNEQVGIYQEGYLSILKENGWYYCDINKVIQIDEAYQEAKPFNNSHAIVKKAEYYGLIDKMGAMIILPQYEDLNWLEDKLIAKKDGFYGLIDINNDTLVDFNWQAIKDGHDGYLCVQQNNFWGMMNSHGKMIIDCIYEEILPVFDECVRVEKDGYYGMFDLTGQLIIPIIYDTLTIAKTNKIIAGVGYRYGYMDNQGQLLTPFMFQTATLPVHHKYSVSFQNQFYLMDDRED